MVARLATVLRAMITAKAGRKAHFNWWKKVEAGRRRPKKYKPEAMRLKGPEMLNMTMSSLRAGSLCSVRKMAGSNNTSKKIKIQGKYLRPPITSPVTNKIMLAYLPNSQE